ncbi:DNA repair protein RAD51 homolog 4 [Anopheles ziemanni]|uniref:DNA repair protein RAD51 homolog 4 n=1 Tax=Anopheles coustani TaxID=139045 RepID=UPI002658C1AA|nr:DNA repair protein RAD51 homolog 4 [Anopheles coustani]XP_058173183.1 DNA repair protein RAD51 homolog 4 [Anopheles ziemanni]
MAATPLSSVAHPMLTEYVIKKLHKNRVSTVYSFVKIQSDQLVKISNLPTESIQDLKNFLVHRFAGCFIDAAEIVENAEGLVSTGIPSLDTLLQGGLMPGQIYELCGTSGSGKTHLCMTLAANVAFRDASSVYFIDTKCDFSATKLQHILERRHSELSERGLGHTMARIKVERILSPQLLVQTIDELAAGKHLKSESRVKLLIIDSLPSLWYLFQDSKSSCQPLGLLTKLVCSLRKLANEHSIAIVVVNLAVRMIDTMDVPNAGKRRSNGGGGYPALGRYWESVPGTRLQLSTTDESDTRMIKVWKSNYLRSGDRIEVRINDAGVG